MSKLKKWLTNHWGNQLTLGELNKKKENAKFISDSYDQAKQQLNIDHAGQRQSLAESANMRGLAQGGDISSDPIRWAMRSGLVTATGAAPTTLAGQVQSDAGVQRGMEDRDLQMQRIHADKTNDAAAMSNYVSKVAQIAKVGAALYTGGASLAATGMPSAGQQQDAGDGRSSIHKAMLSHYGWDSVNPVNPLGEPTSKWYTGPRNAQPGMTNADFNVGG